VIRNIFWRWNRIGSSMFRVTAGLPSTADHAEMGGDVELWSSLATFSRRFR
jgi:hypothetical protein